MIDPKTNSLYKEITSNNLTCRLGGTEVNVYNFSMLINEQFGRSKMPPSTYLVSPDEKIYNFQTYSQIDDISIKKGSKAGGQMLTLSGSYFYNGGNLPIEIEIGGKF